MKLNKKYRLQLWKSLSEIPLDDNTSSRWKYEREQFKDMKSIKKKKNMDYLNLATAVVAGLIFSYRIYTSVNSVEFSRIRPVRPTEAAYHELLRHSNLVQPNVLTEKEQLYLSKKDSLKHAYHFKIDSLKQDYKMKLASLEEKLK